MSKKKNDLSDIKTYELEETSSFTDLMTKKEKKKRKINTSDSSDIEDMINEKRKNTEELKKELEKAKNEYNSEIINKEKNDKNLAKEKATYENLGKTQILELTRQMKFNFENIKNENSKKKNGLTLLNIIGTFNLICIGFYIYLLTFSDYQDNQTNYLIAGSIIILLVLFFGVSVISGKKLRKVFNVFNIITIFGFIAFNIYILI